MMAGVPYYLPIVFGILQVVSLMSVTPGVSSADEQGNTTVGPGQTKSSVDDLVTHNPVGDATLGTTTNNLNKEVASTTQAMINGETTASNELTTGLSVSESGGPVESVTPTIKSGSNDGVQEPIGVTVIIPADKPEGVTVQISPSPTRNDSLGGTTGPDSTVLDSLDGVTVSVGIVDAASSLNATTGPISPTPTIPSSYVIPGKTLNTSLVSTTEGVTPTLGDISNVSSAYMIIPGASVIESTPDVSTVQPTSMTADANVSVTPTGGLIDDTMSSIQPTSMLTLPITPSPVYVSTISVDQTLQNSLNETVSPDLTSSSMIPMTEYPSSSMVTPALLIPSMSDSAYVSMETTVAMFTSAMNTTGSSMDYASQGTVGLVDSSATMELSSDLYTVTPTISMTSVSNNSSVYGSMSDSSVIVVTPSLSPSYVPATSVLLDPTSIVPTVLPTTSIVQANTTAEPPTTNSDVTTTTNTITTQLPPRYNIKIKLVLSGNCTILNQMKAADNLMDFNKKIISALSQQLRMSTNHIQLDSAECGSVIVVVQLVNLTADMDVEALVRNMSREGELFTASNGNSTFGFTLINSEILLPDKPVAPPTSRPPTKVTKLTNVQIIVIIVCSIVGGMLIIYAFGFCIYACYQKKKTKSFDLGETPVNNLHMEDFTLTKLQRPQPTYTDYGPIAHQRGVNGKSKKKNGHYQPIEDEMQCLAPDDIHQASTLPQGSTIEVSLDTEVEPTYHNVNSHGKARAGFDNPSFSSDDILDSGPDTDHELPPEPHQAARNYGYHVDDVVTNSNTNGHVRGEGATSF